MGSRRQLLTAFDFVYLRWLTTQWTTTIKATSRFAKNGPMHPLKVIDVVASGVARKCRRMAWIPSVVVLSGQFPATVLAQDSTDPMEVCYRMSDADLRHTCFDNEMQRRHGLAAHGPTIAPTAPAAPAPTSAPLVTSANTSINTAKHGPADDTIGLDGKQLIIKRKEEGIQPEIVKPMAAAIARLKTRPGHLYYFELDNGQVWESTDSEADLFLGPHETVLIRPGVLGAFFLKTPEGRSIRVHRLR
jgi:hypothetical protein